MNTRELRIDNFICLIDRTGSVHIPIEDVVFKIVEIGIFKSKVVPFDANSAQVEWIDVDNFDLSPISVTEELLLMLGFVKGSDIFEDWPEYEKGFDIGKSITLSHDFECYQGIYSQKINYVHQLQNLYFALTGHELELK